MRQRLDDLLLARFWYPQQVARLAERYELLFCTRLRQIKHFPGPVLVDIDDPTFASSEMTELNRDNVVAVVTTTNLLRTRLLSAGLRKPCHVVPSGVHLSHLDEDHVVALRRSLRKRKGVVVAGFAAPRLYMDGDRRAKGETGKLRSLSFLRKAMEQVWSADPRVDLWLMGVPSWSVKRYADAHAQVRLLGYVPHDEVLKYYALFDIALYPRLGDMGGRHSIKLVEYMAAGVPVLSTAVSESFQLLRSGGGITAEGVEGFAQQLLELAANTSLRQRLGLLGQEYAQRFDWETLAARYQHQVIERYVHAGDG